MAHLPWILGAKIGIAGRVRQAPFETQSQGSAPEGA
jgi:hypothetical protein